MATPEAHIDHIHLSTYKIPTDAPEADGTLAWRSTTIVLAEIHGAGCTGLGYTYGSAAIAKVAAKFAERCLRGRSLFAIPALHHEMLVQVRNNGSRGLASMAISALDVALWDLKARVLGCPLADLLGRAQESVAVYGSGGFTSYSDTQLTAQLARWADEGIRMMKIKVGSHPEDDARRVRVARKAVGDRVGLFVDANGAYSVKQAIALSEKFATESVTWFEEPVSSDRLDDMGRVRDAIPAPMEVAAGEYGYDPLYFRRMLEAGAVDVLQLDATRCGGITGFLEGAAVAGSFGMPLSAHCAPALHVHVACAVPGFRHIEYFHDHVRIERMLFDGWGEPKNGRLKPASSAPGLGLTLKREDAERFAA